MQVRGVVLVTVALALGIAALILHLLALCSPHWKITKRDVEPIVTPVSYGLWDRCENLNVSIMKQGLPVGLQQNVPVCRRNFYMRYSPDDFHKCYNFRRQCLLIRTGQIPKECSCHYLPSTKALQWLTIIAAIFLIIGLLLLYLKTITQPQNESAVFLLSYAPFICFLLALLLIITGLILLGAFLRRDTYEDYSFPLYSVTNNTREIQSFDINSLRIYAKAHAATFTRDQYKKAEEELRTDADTHFHTIIGRATIYEVIAAVLIILVTIVTFWLGTASRSEDI